MLAARRRATLAVVVPLFAAVGGVTFLWAASNAPVDFFLPKFIDYDPVRGYFRIDRRHYRKQMDWSYAPLDALAPATGGPSDKGKADSGGEEQAADGDDGIEV